MSKAAVLREPNRTAPPSAGVVMLLRDAPDEFHPLAIGATVTIFKLPRDRAPFIEGRAVIRGILPGRDRYRVQFLGERAVRQRFVHHEYQPDPKKMLRMLLDLWRDANEPDADEFFPPEDDT